MIRLSWIVCCLISTISWCQLDSLSSELDALNDEALYVPVTIDGQWIWYDIANNRPSDSVHITDIVQPELGFNYQFILKNDSLWGVLSSSGYIVVPFQYDSVISISNHLMTLSNGEWSYHKRLQYDSFRDEVSDSLIPISFDSLYFDGTELYLFHQGKTGMILVNGSLIPPKYDGIQRFSCTGSTIESMHYLSLLGENYNLLNEDGEELLPTGVVDLRCTEDGVVEFKRGEHPEFYVPYTKEFLRPNGRDIIFYGNLGHKIYNEEKTKAEFHLGDGGVLKETYDDYFFLYDDFFVVRKEDKVGLTRNGTQLISALKYDQINASTYHEWGATRNYFRFYHGDSCGLMDKNGQEVLEANYANIVPTSDENRFIVLDKDLAGVVDRSGRTIVPIKYDYISFDERLKLFLVQLNERVGLLNFDGSVLIPVEYTSFHVLEYFGTASTTDALMVLKKNGNFYFAKLGGFIQKAGFNHYDHTKGILKTYDAKVISVFIFNNEGKLEEKQDYPLFENAIIRKNYYNHWDVLYDWTVSELEENQQKGYFGLRHYTKRGFGVKPVYRTVQPTLFDDYIGTIGTNSLSHDWIGRTQVEIVRGFDHLKTGTGTINTPTFFSSDMLLGRYGSGDRYINLALNGKQNLSYSKLNGVPTIGLSDPILYVDRARWNTDYIKYLSGGTAELCPIESADISYFDYYNYLNSLSACKVSDTLMKAILNPTLGVRFVNSDVGVINSSFSGVHDDRISFWYPSFYEKFEFLNHSIFFEQREDDESGRLRMKFLSEENDEETTINGVASAKEVFGNIGDYIVAEMNCDKLAKVHIDYPDFLFIQDSIDLNYVDGRIVRKLDSNNVRLITPHGKVIADSCLQVRYLKEGCFAVLRSSGWTLIDRNGKLLSNRTFFSVSEFKQNQAEFGLQDGTAVILNSNGEEVMPLPEPRLFLDDDYYYFATKPNQIFHRKTNTADELQEGEEYRSPGFVVSRGNGKIYIRQFGAERTIELKSDITLKVFGTCLYYRKGKHIYSIDSNLVTKKFKKIDKFSTVTPEIGWLQGKRDQLIDFDWNYICKMTKDERFELRDGNLIVFDNDSVFRNFGSLKPIEKYPELAETSVDIKVTVENGKYGVRSGEEVLLPFKYAWLSKVNDQEYFTKVNTQQHIYTSQLERIGRRPFDWYIQTYFGDFVFYSGGQTFVVSEDGSEERLIRP